MLSLKLFIVVAAYAAIASAAPDKVVCYYGSWAVYRPGNGKFAVEDINPFKCTHAVYAFVGINADASIRILDQWNEIDLKAIQRFNNLKKKNPKLKTLVAIGGWNEGSTTFSAVAKSASKRNTFATNALEFIKKHGFDGFDLDWEYPAQRGGSPADKKNFGLLIQALRRKFGKKYLLTAAVAAAKNSAKTSYDIAGISKDLDFINVMAYDFHGAFDGKTGHNAPLHQGPEDDNPELNIDAAVKYWRSQGTPSHKLVLGMPVYGRTFTVQNTKNHDVNNQASAGNPGPWTQEAGYLGYTEICLRLKDSSWKTKFDATRGVMSAYNGNQWISYDTVVTTKIKSQYVVAKNLGGAMIWSIETDDARGLCGEKYPILTAINEVLFGQPNSD